MSSSSSVNKESNNGKKRRREDIEELSEITAEEADRIREAASNLILLSQEDRNEIDQAAADPVIIEENIERIVPSIQTVESAAGSTNDDNNTYVCKTCNRDFSSFQALGGHMTSHRRTRLHPDEHKVKSYTKEPPVVSKKGSEEKEKKHKCKKCPAVFSSGQALGGHMGKHKSLEDEDNGSKKKKCKFSTQNHPDDLINMPSSSRQTDTDGDSVVSDRATEEQPPNGGLVFDLNLPAQGEIDMQLSSGSLHPKDPPTGGDGDGDGGGAGSGSTLTK